MVRVLLPLACILGSTDGARVARSRERVSIESNATDCAGYEDIAIRGKNVGQVASIVCKYWPTSKLGEFPYGTADKMFSVADAVLNPGGLYDQINKIWDDRNSNPSVCWRRLKFPTSESLLEAASMNDDNDDLDLYHLPLTPVDGSLSEGGANSTATWADCPSGYAKAPLTGWALGLCKSTCSTPGLEHQCSLSCTAGWWSCTKTIMDQVSATMSLVGKIASFIFSNDAISKAVDAVIDLADFVAKVLETAVTAVKSALTGDKKEGTAALLMTLFQLVMDNMDYLGETFDSLKGKFESITDIISDVIDEGFDSSYFSWNSLASKMLNSGSSIMESTLALSDAFLHPRCAVKA